MGFLHEQIILPLSDLLRGEQVHKYLKLMEIAEEWAPEQMEAFQKERLQNLIILAATEVPFYRDWFHDHNLDPQTAILDQLPIVSKAIMRQGGIKRFTAEHFPVKDRILSRSSGSTGEPFSFYVSKTAYSVNTAAKLRTWYLAGADGITSALASMAAGICFSLSTTLSELSVVGLPLMMSVTS